MSAAIWQDHGTFGGLAEAAHDLDLGPTELDIARRHQFNGEAIHCSTEEAPDPVWEMQLSLAPELQRFARVLPQELWISGTYRDDDGIRRKRVLFALSMRHDFPLELLKLLDRDVARVNRRLALYARLNARSSMPTGRVWRAVLWLVRTFA